MRAQWIGSALLITLLTGCAGVRHRSVRLEPKLAAPAGNTDQNLARLIEQRNGEITATNAQREGSLEGIRYYRPAPYLLVYSDGKDSLRWEIHYLPDPATKASAQPYNYLASLKATLEFNEKGTLKSVNEVPDSAAIPKAVLAAIEKVASSAAAALLQKGPDNDVHQFPPPKLYKIVIRDGLVSLQGGGSAGIDVIRANPGGDK